MKDHRKAFERFADRLGKNLGEELEKLFLFGSVARGQEDEESDVDVLVVLKDKNAKNEVFEVSYDVMLEEDIYISPKVVSREEFEELQGTSFAEEISEEAETYA